MRKLLLVVAALALAGCETLGIPPIDLTSPSDTAETAAPAPTPPPVVSTPPRANGAAVQQQLFELERRLAAAAQEQGYGAALASTLDPAQGFVVRPGAVLEGGDAVRGGLGTTASGGPIFWAPDRVFVADAGDMGVTSGRYVEVDAASRAAQGRYVIVWRRDAGGNWKVLSETRTPDPVRAAPRRR